MPRVLLIMIDGARPDALTAAACPHLDAFRARGASTMQAQSVMPSVTLPCHMAIFHSVPPERHGITANLYLPLARPLPGLVEVLRAAGKRSGMIYNWEPLRDLSRPEQLALAWYREPPLDESFDEGVAHEAIRSLREDALDFTFLYFGSVDIAGHHYGWMSDGYLRQLERVDALFGQVLAAVDADTTVIVHADHGGHDRTHGTTMPEDMCIPWMIAGPGITAGHTITEPVSLLDTAPTVAHILGVACPAVWEGRAVG